MIIKLTSLIKPNSLKVAMGYRGISQTELCKNINGLSQHNLSKFLKGYHSVISEDKLKEVMVYLKFPYEFLYKEIKPINIL